MSNACWFLGGVLTGVIGLATTAYFFGENSSTDQEHVALSEPDEEREVTTLGASESEVSA